MILLLLIFILRSSSIVFKDQVNDFITIKLPFITKCKECRFYNIGMIEGVLLGLFLSSFL